MLEGKEHCLDIFETYLIEQSRILKNYLLRGFKITYQQIRNRDKIKTWLSVNSDNLVMWIGIVFVFLGLQGIYPIPSETGITLITIGNVSIFISAIYKENVELALITIVMVIAQISQVLS
jgi:hypothetical protein